MWEWERERESEEVGERDQGDRVWEDVVSEWLRFTLFFWALVGVVRCTCVLSLYVFVLELEKVCNTENSPFLLSLCASAITPRLALQKFQWIVESCSLVKTLESCVSI
jgi:hypothetical protein